MAVIGIDVQDVKRLDGRIKITAKYPIAHGGYSDIYPGIWRGGSAFLGPGVWTGNATSGQNVAVVIKVMRHADRDLKANDPITRSKYAKDLEKEYRVWAHLRHPNVLPFFGLIDDPAIPSMGVVTPRCTFGDLRCFFSDPTRASSANRLSIVKGIARGLTYIHGKRVVHGDLTMENVLIELINGVFTPLISDFGLSRVLETEAESRWFLFETFKSISFVPRRHLPPEILLAEDENQSRKALTLGADVWCFGMVMLETLTGKSPFFHLIEFQAAQMVALRNEKPNQNLYPTFTHDKRCWHVDPSHREKMPGLLPSINALR